MWRVPKFCKFMLQEEPSLLISFFLFSELYGDASTPIRFYSKRDWVNGLKEV